MWNATFSFVSPLGTSTIVPTSAPLHGCATSDEGLAVASSPGVPTAIAMPMLVHAVSVVRRW
jgi:hypothetical protein